MGDRVAGDLKENHTSVHEVVFLQVILQSMTEQL